MAASRKHGTLVASTVATVEVGPAQVADRNAVDIIAVEVVSLGPLIYFTVGGATPTVKGDDTYVCQAGGAVRVATSGRSPASVKLIAAAAGDYSVEAFTG